MFRAKRKLFFMLLFSLFLSTQQATASEDLLLTIGVDDELSIILDKEYIEGRIFPPRSRKDNQVIGSFMVTMNNTSVYKYVVIISDAKEHDSSCFFMENVDEPGEFMWMKLVSDTMMNGAKGRHSVSRNGILRIKPHFTPFHKEKCNIDVIAAYHKDLEVNPGRYFSRVYFYWYAP